VRDADLARAAGDSAVPRKFIEGCPNDLIEARRRWRITKAWRDEFGIDTVRGLVACSWFGGGVRQCVWGVDPLSHHIIWRG
jgi:hypothetical protein